MDIQINPKKAARELEKAKNKAQRLMEDPEKAQKVLAKAVKLSNKAKGPFGNAWENIQLMFGIIHDWFSGRYREIPGGSILAILGAIIYFVSPIDMIPDFIPIVGYLDDAFIMGLVIKQIGADLQTYKAWKGAQQLV
jgi:uncharacterized membrane protein YkvA (DUF1232 family)